MMEFINNFHTVIIHTVVYFLNHGVLGYVGLYFDSLHVFWCIEALRMQEIIPHVRRVPEESI